MNLLIIGSGRHGKDEVAIILQKLYGMSFDSSSHMACDLFLYDKLAPQFGYRDTVDCFEDRHNHRALWAKEITEYNTPDKAKLAKEIMLVNDVYVGMRCKHEIAECKRIGLFDLIIWVDAGGRVSYREGSDSMTVTKEDADMIIYNNDTIEALEARLKEVFDGLQFPT